MTELTIYSPPRLADPIALIERSGRAESTINLYTGVLRPIAGRITDVQALVEYAANLSESRQRTLKSALSLWVRECSKRLEANVTPATLQETQATIMRLGALPDAIKTTTPKGKRAHTWLTQKQIDALYRVCGDDLLGLRDRVAIGLMVTTGVRRAELVALRWQHIVKQPFEGELCAVLNVVQGKGGKDRNIPLTTAMETLLDEWASWTGRKGYIVRRVGIAQDFGDPEIPISCASIHNLVKKRGDLCSIPGLACHDLRRTFAQAIWSASGDLLLVGDLLGHSSIETTRVYLHLDAAERRRAVEAIKWGV